MRTHAAGTFAMNCSWNSIPCIGYYGLDTQEILHPLTTVEVGDLEGAKELGKRLKNDLSFYTECARITTQKFKEYYTEEAWLKHWEKENK